MPTNEFIQPLILQTILPALSSKGGKNYTAGFYSSTETKAPVNDSFLPYLN